MWLTFSGVRGCMMMMVKKKQLFAIVCAWFEFYIRKIFVAEACLEQKPA